MMMKILIWGFIFELLILLFLGIVMKVMKFYGFMMKMSNAVDNN